MDKETAKGYAIDAFMWMAKDKQVLDAFLSCSGANASDLRIRSNDPEFLTFVMDFLMTSDKMILDLSKELNILPEKLQTARSILAGGELIHWT